MASEVKYRGFEFNVTKDKKAERAAYRQKRKLFGLCQWCSQPVVPGKVLCKSHAEKNNRLGKDRADRTKRQLICVKCRKQSSEPGRTQCNACVKKIVERRNYIEAERIAAGLCVVEGCPNDHLTNKKYCSGCLNRCTTSRRRLKQIVLDHYGEVCHCLCGCKVTKFEWLTIDHKNNDGAKRRKEHGTGTKFHRYIIENNFPDDLQVLCWNCNCAKAFFGVCK